MHLPLREATSAAPPPSVSTTEDHPELSPHYLLDQLLSLLPPQDISVMLLNADWDRSGSGLLQLRICWRFAGTEDTSVESLPLLVTVRLLVEGIADE